MLRAKVNEKNLLLLFRFKTTQQRNPLLSLSSSLSSPLSSLRSLSSLSSPSPLPSLSLNFSQPSSLSPSSLSLSPLSPSLFSLSRSFSSSQRDCAPRDSETKLSEKYQKKTPVEHVLLRPDSYVGSINQRTTFFWVPKETKKRGEKEREWVMEKREVNYIPGLLKLFDEILVNASDNKRRDPKMQTLRVDIDKKEGRITIENDGECIPTIKHTKENMYIPEMVFGHLLTGSNFDDSVKKVTGGRNGYGAKLANIFSKDFKVHIRDQDRGCTYTQTWENNMSTCSPPQISPLTQKEKSLKTNSTTISFVPDLPIFSLKSLSKDDTALLMERRVYDMAGTMEGVKVFLNGERLKMSFEEYVQRYPVAEPMAVEGEEKDACDWVMQRVNPRWQIAVGMSEDAQFQHVCFVNGIYTPRGGTHVTHITDQICTSIASMVNRRHRGFVVHPTHVKNHLFVAINCLIENPSFDSQTKDTLTSGVSSFGSSCRLPPRFLNKLFNSTNLESRIVAWALAKQKIELEERTKKVKRGKISGIPKLEDANLAGGPQARESTLIITEGDSAKALAVSGLSVLGRDKYGVFPLRGKMLNVRDASHEKVLSNEEIRQLEIVLGLSHDETYECDDIWSKGVRYGKVMLMTDQDYDGFHIKGLFINFIHRFWPALLSKHDFLQQFVTPIVKVSRGKEKISFFDLGEYREWSRGKGEDIKKWDIKYYKGLGTSTAEEGREYFRNLKKQKIDFLWGETNSSSSSSLSSSFENPNEADSAIDLAFSKKNSDLRKNWLLNYSSSLSPDSSSSHYDFSTGTVTYSDFVNKELIQFSHADNIRAIPSLMDGLKPGQRKVLYACLKRNLNKEIKVSQLSGYVSEKTAYHHGEASLQSTIVNMAADYMGSNNIPYLLPIGQFGTRMLGGSDAASARYIFTKLSPVTRLIFREEDDPLLDLLNDDGVQVEPRYFVPIIPTILVNGTDGIGTGWSTKICSFSPLDIIENVRKCFNNEELFDDDILPFYKDFKGTISLSSSALSSSPSYSVSVPIKKQGRSLHISELPIGKWTTPYIDFLSSLSSERGSILSSFSSHHTDKDINFSLSLSKRGGEIKEKDLREMLKLKRTISFKNAHLFDEKGEIKNFLSPSQIIQHFVPIRLSFYQKRRVRVEREIQEKVLKLEEKMRFIERVVGGEIEIMNVERGKVEKRLKEMGFGERKREKEKEKEGEFDHLFSMPLSEFTKEKVFKLKESTKDSKRKLKELKGKEAKDLWEEDLNQLYSALEKDFKR